MKHLTVLMHREWLEAWRNFKWIWIPLVFVLLGVTQPITSYYMEDLLRVVGNLPDGFQMAFPQMTATDIFLSTTGQFQMLGLIVCISAFVGGISRERQNGTATLLYVRPISATTVFLSKWIVSSVIAIGSATAGYIGCLYYTVLLYGAVDGLRFVQMVFTYAIWLCFVLAFTLAMSAAFKTAVAATIAMLVLPFGVTIDMAIGGFWTWTPWKLATYGVEWMAGTVSSEDFQITIVFTMVLIVCAVLFGIWKTKQNWSWTKL